MTTPNQGSTTESPLGRQEQTSNTTPGDEGVQHAYDATYGDEVEAPASPLIESSGKGTGSDTIQGSEQSAYSQIVESTVDADIATTPTGFAQRLLASMKGAVRRRKNNAEPIEGDKQEKTKHRPTRRQILAAAAGTIATATIIGRKEWTDSWLSTELLAPDPENIPSQVPPELHGFRIPHSNEHYRRDFTEVIYDGLSKYSATGAKPFYKRPSNYLTEGRLLWDTIDTLVHTGSVSDVGEANPWLSFSANLYTGVSDLYGFDPGSTAKLKTEKQLAALGVNANTPLPENAMVTEGDMTIADTYMDEFNQARAYIDELRGPGRVSTSELFAYYLGENKGDITQSLLDTTTFLKLASRVDLNGLSNLSKSTDGSMIYSPNYADAKLISSMFNDEFASEIPLEWLTDVVPEGSPLNDVDYKSHADWKDFDPINRAGLPYHIWNIFTLCAATDPQVAKKIVLAYYNNTTNPYDTTAQQGRVKVRADMNAIAQVNDIRAMFDNYAV